MIKAITVTNHLAESIKLELAFPEKSGFAIQSIEGLGPNKANIYHTEITTIDGAVFNSARKTSRNIVLNLQLLEKPTIETTRQLLYKYFPLKQRIKLEISTDNRTCETYGYVESNEPNIFTKSETTQISIICPDPNFYSKAKNVVMFSGVENEFEFPFSNESLSENLLVLGSIVNNTTQNVFYTGESEVGVLIKIHALGSVTGLTIYNNVTREQFSINDAVLEELTGFGIISSDTIFISTSKGNKTVTLFRDGIYFNILNAIDRDSDWFQLVPGDNLFVYTADTGLTDLQFSIENVIAYEGV